MEPAGRQRQHPIGLQPPVELGLHGMEQAALRERVHALQRLEVFGWTQAIDGAEQELIGARGVALERRERVDASRESVGVQQRLRPLGRLHDTVPLRPRLSSDACSARGPNAVASRSAAACSARARAPCCPVRPPVRAAWRGRAPVDRSRCSCRRAPARPASPSTSGPLPAAVRRRSAPGRSWRATLPGRTATARAGAPRRSRRSGTTRTARAPPRRPRAAGAASRPRHGRPASASRPAGRRARRRAAADPRAASAETSALPVRARRPRRTCGRATATGWRRTHDRRAAPAAPTPRCSAGFVSTRAASSSDTGPTSPIGRRSASTRSTRSGRDSTRGTSCSK